MITKLDILYNNYYWRRGNVVDIDNNKGYKVIYDEIDNNYDEFIPFDE